MARARRHSHASPLMRNGNFAFGTSPGCGGSFAGRVPLLRAGPANLPDCDRRHGGLADRRQSANRLDGHGWPLLNHQRLGCVAINELSTITLSLCANPIYQHGEPICDWRAAVQCHRPRQCARDYNQPDRFQPEPCPDRIFPPELPFRWPRYTVCGRARSLC